MAFKRTYLLLLHSFLLLNTLISVAQVLGNHDADIQWQTLDSERVRILFPTGTEVAAKRMADVINHIHSVSATTLGEQSQKIDLILQNQQSQSNGFVTLAPFRTEFFGLAPQNQQSLGTTDWLDLLSIHEYRHVLQYSNAKRGFSRFMYFISGQNGWGAAMNFSMPDWYFEGDAVLSETLLTKSGRGRTASFFKEMRALLLEDTIYPYDKAQNGSFKDLVPNHYKLGYVISSHLRNTYGPEINKKIIADAGSYKYLLYPFSKAVKKQTGRSTRTLYKESYTALQKKWLQQTESTLYTKSKTLIQNTDQKIAHYQFPHYLPDGSVLSLKNSVDETPAIVRIKNREVHKLKNLEITSQEYLSATKNTIVWTRYTKDWRHDNKNYSDIVAYDLQTEKKTRITDKKRYFSPNISPDLSKVVAVHYDENIAYSLHILDIASGNILMDFSDTEHSFISTPKWSLDGEKIIYLAKKEQRIAFFEIDIVSRQQKQLSPWTHKSIGQFSLSPSHIYFSADFEGLDNLYRISLSKEQSIEKITDEKVGAYMPQIANDTEKLVYSVFTKRGYRLRELSLADIIPVSFALADASSKHLPKITTTDREKNLLDNVPKNNYTTKAYNGFFRGLKFHSWGWVVDPTNFNNIGAQLQFENLLGELSSSVSMVHNSNENRNSIATDVSYGKYLVVPSLRFNTQERSSINTFGKIPVNLQFTEKIIATRLSLPLSQINGNYLQNFNISTGFSRHYTSNYNFGNGYNLNFSTIGTRITASNIRRTALQNIYPRFGQYITIDHEKSIEKETAEKIGINGLFFFPGLQKNHSLNTQISWHRELLENPYQFPDTFQYARGYNRYFSDENFTIAMNYDFPIAYPDWGFYGICYFKRFRGRLFADKAIVNSYKIEITEGIDLANDPTIDLSTFSSPRILKQNAIGGSLLMDLVFFNKIPLTLGLRNSFLLNTPDNKRVFQLFFNVAL